jgi:hypothetical protein
MLILCTSLSLVAALHRAASGSEHRVLVATDTIRAVPHRWGNLPAAGFRQTVLPGCPLRLRRLHPRAPT